MQIFPTRCRAGFPRIRGDVPVAASRAAIDPWFSPHTRGCSQQVVDGPQHAVVFPAYAGMFLIEVMCERRDVGFPRIRGDVPRLPT